MGKSTARAAIGMAVLCMLPALPAMAADLLLKVDNHRSVVAVTNTLPKKVTLLYLQGTDGMNLPLFAQLEKGATVNVPLRFEMPSHGVNAVCEVDNQRRYMTVEIR